MKALLIVLAAILTVTALGQKVDTWEAANANRKAIDADVLERAKERQEAQKKAELVYKYEGVICKYYDRWQKKGFDKSTPASFRRYVDVKSIEKVKGNLSNDMLEKYESLMSGKVPKKGDYPAREGEIENICQIINKYFNQWKKNGYDDKTAKEFQKSVDIDRIEKIENQIPDRERLKFLKIHIYLLCGKTPARRDGLPFYSGYKDIISLQAVISENEGYYFLFSKGERMPVYIRGISTKDKKLNIPEPLGKTFIWFVGKYPKNAEKDFFPAFTNDPEEAEKYAESQGIKSL